MALALLVSGCASRGATLPSSLSTPPGRSTADLASYWDGNHVSSPFSPMVDHAEVERRVKALPSPLFTVSKGGESVEGRAIYHVTAGRGSAHVLLWSQMHGDEPSATSALFDVFKFLEGHETDAVAARILDRLTLHVVPMLNPDGAERFQRRNAMGIDINRDARRLATPEARLLKQLRDEIKPLVGFNLHNQSWRTRAGDNPAAISLLSVAYDQARSMNAGRLLTKRLATAVRNSLQPIAGGRIGRYDDSFEPRAFGDNITLWGTPVLLIETGPWPDENPDPALVRLNFIALVSALDALATGRVHYEDERRYDALPLNDSGLFYRIVRGGRVLRGDGQPAFVADVGIMAQRRVQGRGSDRQLWIASGIDDVGDLSTAPTLFEIDATGLIVAPLVPGAVEGQEIALPAWTSDAPSAALVAPGAPASLMLLRPLENGRYTVARVIQATWRVDK